MKMKSKFLVTTWVILFALSSSCQREKESEVKNQKLPQPITHEVTTTADPEKAALTTPRQKIAPTVAFSSNNKELYEWRAGREAFRIKLFSIPLSTTAARDRADAWEKLAIPDDELRSSSEQLQGARMLLDQYANGTQIEKLVFWRLVAYRISSHRPGAIVRTLGDQGPSMTGEKLEEMLYSALGLTPSETPYDQAIAEGLKVIDQAVK